MGDENIQLQIDAINNKLDIILEEIALQRSHRLEMEDLKDDLMRIGDDVFKTAVEEFEELSDTIAPGDFWHLTKKLIRNVNNITQTFEQLESIKDFAQDAIPVSRELFNDFLYKMDEFDRKGYFKFIQEVNKIMDNIVTSFTPEDVKQLADNVVTILNTVKNLTQPQMLNMVNNTVNVLNNFEQAEEDKKISTFSLVKQINSPEMKKKLSLLIELLKNINKHSK